MPRVPGRLRRFLGCGLIFAPLLLPAATPDKNAAGVEFFESKIRPILVNNCYKCHSRQSEKVRGGLLLDTREGLRQGGDSGPAVVPGHPEKSLLVRAVSYTDKDLQMPPKDQKLPEEQIANLRAWVKMGAPDPRASEAEATQAKAMAAAREHWAFQPVVEPAPPKIHWHKSWMKTPLDAFVLENLKSKKLKPSPPADKRTLLRRATFDLIGLPPTQAELDAFLTDKSKDAFAKVVDRLLASPHYGERWGRYWLDVARYADTKGQVNGTTSARLPYAYTYRDYVVQSFNNDLPYNQFILEQLAADQLPAKTNDNRALAAMGFLTVGRQFFGNDNEIIDDRIDVVSRGLLGLTVSCARCHDHKFDPIPTRDYYSLHGVFRSSIEPTNLPLLTVPLPARYEDYLTDLRTNQAALDEYIHSNELVVLAEVRSNAGEYLLATRETAPFATNTLKVEEYLRERKLNNAVYLGWKTNLVQLEKKDADLFQPWFAFAKLPETNWTARAADLAGSFATNRDLNPLVAKMFDGPAPTNLPAVAEDYDRLFGQTATNASNQRLLAFMEATNSPLNPPRSEFARVFLFNNAVISKIQSLRNRVESVDATDPGAPPRAMVLRDRPNPVTSRIFLRGNPGSLGAEAPREFLQVLSRPDEKPFPKKSSGRLQLAEDIASPDNPLTARVFVNRVWMHHFGAALVPTPSDFGVRTPKPLQGKLLDYLAARFMADGWSIKKLHRLIMLSAVYQQSSDDNATAEKIDPDDDYLWRMPRQRLDLEAMRDSMLSVAGQLDEKMGGQPVDISRTNAIPARRTIYALVDRSSLPEFFHAFDFADPDTSSAERFETTVAPQALFLLNSPFMAQCARGLAARCGEGAPDEESKIRRFYEILFQRKPTPGEIELAREYVANQPARDTLNPESAAWQYGWGTYDKEAPSEINFQPLPLFTNSSWWPEKSDWKTAGGVFLNAFGGRPGRTNFAAIRRWVAPRDGTISISGEFTNNQSAGDGARGRIVSSRTGLLGEWTVHNKHVSTSLEKIDVKQNETIDFVVDNPRGKNSGIFYWAPVIRMEPIAGEEIGLPHVWNARENFIDPKKARPTLGAWEKYAQVLLFSNEFFFID